MTRAGKLDKIDWRILYELQNDARITNVELARRAGISPPPCLRRVRALEDAGIIQGYRAVLANEKLGCDVIMFAMVGLHSQAETDLASFEAHMRNVPIVRECYSLFGEIDFILKCVARDVHAVQAFISDLTGWPNVAHVKTRLTLNVAKYEPGPPLTESGPAFDAG